MKRCLLMNKHFLNTNKSLHLKQTPCRFFHLDKQFVASFKNEKAPFGFNGVGEFTYRRTYARQKEDGSGQEEWFETVARVVNGTFKMQKDWINEHHLGWDDTRAQRSAQEMYRRIFSMKFLPPGRGLWAMGSPIIEKKSLYAALNNCGFVSTENLSETRSKPFLFLMDASMLGVGVGFDVKGALDKNLIIQTPQKAKLSAKRNVYVIPDEREGWLKSVQLLIESFFVKRESITKEDFAIPYEVIFDYSKLRAKGAPIKIFGGKSSGPESLKEIHDGIRDVLESHNGKSISERAIVDIMNIIGKGIVAGNTMRTAEIAFGDPNSEEYITLKNYEKNPERQAFGWISNNSVFATLGMDYERTCKEVVNNGEPGFAFLENMQKYSRMGREPDNKDYRASGGNPCLEQTLESYELCCLVETFPDHHDTFEDFQETLKCAYLYAKTVTLGNTHWPETNQVLLRNRRIGCSLSGIVQFVDRMGLGVLRDWCNKGYAYLQKLDEIYSNWFCIPRSIKITSIKPSGTVSLLAGATPGMHFPSYRHYIRRIRVERNSPLLVALANAGYSIEDDVYSSMSKVVSFPVSLGSDKMRTVNEVSMWEQMELAAFLQEHWADNQVSATVTFDQEKEGAQLKHALDFYQYRLKGISFLPRFSSEDGKQPYKQMPYESISKERYDQMCSSLKPIQWNDHTLNAADPEMETFCNNDTCVVVNVEKKAADEQPSPKQELASPRKNAPIQVVGEYNIMDEHPQKHSDWTIKSVLGDNIGYVKLKYVNPTMCPIVFDEKTQQNIKLSADFVIVEAARTSTGRGLKSQKEDSDLQSYLAQFFHTSPCEQAELTFIMMLPLCIAVHFLRHRSAHVNQESLRYTNKQETAKFYVPTARTKSKTNKQGSISSANSISRENDWTKSSVFEHSRSALDLYSKMVDDGVAEEVARFVLPQNMYTTLLFKIDLHNLFHLLKLRLDHHAQLETQLYAQAMYDLIKPVFPQACKDFENYTLNAIHFSEKEIESLKTHFEKTASSPLASIDLSNFARKSEKDAFLSKLHKITPHDNKKI
jgi:ribonucleoside-triphosphate reductase (thioredoxin)